MLWSFKARYCRWLGQAQQPTPQYPAGTGIFVDILPTCFLEFELHALPFRALEFGEYRGLEIITCALYAGMGSKLVPKSLVLEPVPQASNFMPTDNSIEKA
jgi:hypothetical protein